jgi:ubiquinone biosynthesis protein
MGFKAVYSKVKANLPFWNEKLPEIPDLVYDYLKTSRENQHQQTQLMQSMLSEQAKQNNRVIYSVIAAAIIIAIAVIVT